MKLLTCPECKNEVELSSYGNIAQGQIIECNSCGITLEITNAENDQLEAVIADEGK